MPCATLLGYNKKACSESVFISSQDYSTMVSASYKSLSMNSLYALDMFVPVMHQTVSDNTPNIKLTTFGPFRTFVTSQTHLKSLRETSAMMQPIINTDT